MSRAEARPTGGPCRSGFSPTLLLPRIAALSVPPRASPCACCSPVPSPSPSAPPARWRKPQQRRDAPGRHRDAGERAGSPRGRRGRRAALPELSRRLLPGLAVRRLDPDRDPLRLDPADPSRDDAGRRAHADHFPERAGRGRRCDSGHASASCSCATRAATSGSSSTQRGSPVIRCSSRNPARAIKARRSARTARCSRGRARPRARPSTRSTSPIPSDARSAKSAYREAGSIAPDDISADRAQVLFTRGISNRESKLFLLDLASGKATQIAPKVSKVLYHERASVARRPQRLCDLHEGQRLRPARADRHRQRQGHGADAGPEMGRRHLRDVRRRSPARVRR